MLGEEGDADGNLEKAVPQVGGDAFVIQDALAVFLGGGHYGGGPVAGGFPDGGNVVPRIFVMVQEGEPLHNMVFVAQETPQGRVFGDARKEDEPVGISKPHVAIFIDGFERLILDGAEQDGRGLVFGVLSGTRKGTEIPDVQGLGPADLLPILHKGRTLGDNDDVRLYQTLRQVAQAAERKKMVFVQRTVIIHQDDVVVGLQAPVLESIVQDDDIGFGKGIVAAGRVFVGLERFGMQQVVAAFHAVAVYGDGDSGEFLLDLQGFVAEHRGTSLAGNLLEAVALAPVAAGQDRNLLQPPLLALLQGPQDHLRMRSLAGTTCGDVADADGGSVYLKRLPDSPVIQGMPKF